MREIKFRVWKDYSCQFEYFTLQDALMSNEDDLQRISNSSPKSFEQYTGFNDDDNKCCYEGDIIRSSYGIPGRVIESEVYFNKGQFMVRCINNKVISPQICTLNEFSMHLGQFWIIGNIHENRKMLNE